MPRVFVGLCRNPDEEGSQFLIGNVNTTQYLAPGAALQWLPLTSAAFWMVALQSFHIGNVDYCGMTATRCRAIIDSGTSYIGIPSRMVPYFVRAVTTGHDCEASTDGFFVCDCSTDFDTYPDISIVFTGVRRVRLLGVALTVQRC